MQFKGFGCVLQFRSHRPSHIWFTASSLNRYLSLSDSPPPILVVRGWKRGYDLHPRRGSCRCNTTIYAYPSGMCRFFAKMYACYCHQYCMVFVTPLANMSRARGRGGGLGSYHINIYHSRPASRFSPASSSIVRGSKIKTKNLTI